MTREEKILEYERINRKYESKYFPKVKKTLDKKISSLIDKLKQDGIDASVRYLQTDIGNYDLTAVIQKLYREVGLRHARKEEIRLRAEVSKSSRYVIQTKGFGNVNEWVKWIQNYLQMFLISKITFTVNETTRRELLGVLTDAIDKGWGIDETVKHLEDMPFTAKQAARIVRTEVNRASNVGVSAQAHSFEYELMKEWISVEDKRTRGVKPKDHADHVHLNGQTVDLEEKFTDPRNGHVLDHPGDPNAKAEDTVNCRCTHTTEAKRDANGRLIRRQMNMAA